VTAEVVSVDAEKNTITLKGETENHTAPVDAKAAGALKTVKAGDTVTVTCWDNAKGEHEKVIAIAPRRPLLPPPSNNLQFRAARGARPDRAGRPIFVCGP
jgi:hypothetical protein